MTLGTVADQLAQVFGMPTYGDAPPLAQARILVDLNAAIQQMQDAGEDFYGREDLAVDLVEGQQLYILPKEVQTVTDPVRLAGGAILTEITQHGAFNKFGEIFQDQLSRTVANGTPTHYFVHPGRDRTDGADDVLIEFYVMPPPDALNAGTAKLSLHVINEPGVVTAGDLVAGTANLPIPHKYVEAIFLPLARYNAMGSFLFYDKDKAPHLEDDYIRALQLLTKADPRRPKPRDSTVAAMELRQSRQPQQPQPQNRGGP